MTKVNAILTVSVLAFSLFFVQGCATDKSFVRNGQASLSPLKVVRYRTPGIIRKNINETFIISAAAVALPGGSVLTAIGDDYAKSRGEGMQQQLPDFGQLVMQKFVEQLGKGKELWPRLIVEDRPAIEGHIETDTLLEFRVQRLAYGYLDFINGAGHGFLSKTVVTMKEPRGKILWQKSFTYSSQDFGRGKEIDAFEADDGKLLKEELAFAIEKTVAAFIEDFNAEKKIAAN
jgi:hypothetical protein